MGGKAKGARRYIALMRGINVGGKNRLPMAELVPLFERAGCTEATSYIQSGNVIFEAKTSVAQQVAQAVREFIAADFGYQIPIVIRDARQWAATAASNPFLAAGSADSKAGGHDPKAGGHDSKAIDPKHLHLMSLSSTPSPSQVAALDSDRFAPDQFRVIGDSIYLYLPDGSARSKLTTGYFDRALQTTSTARNWNTVRKLATLSAGAGHRSS